MIVPVRVTDAVGKRLAHDYTCIEPGYKGAVKRRGDLINHGDVEVLKNCGHYYVYIEVDNTASGDYVHEVEAVKWLGEIISGENVEVKLFEEGKANLHALANGLLLVESSRLYKLNSSGLFVVVTLRNGSYVKRGDLIGVVDLIPLTVKKSSLDELQKRVVNGPLLRVVPSKKPKVALLVTGTEIVEGVREDMCTPVVAMKLKQYDCELADVDFARDDLKEIADKIVSFIKTYDAVVVTGGMSVDPTDYTPKSIELIASEIVAYGIPIKPTTMSMIAYIDNKPVIGVSSGIIKYPNENILDIVLPWISAGVKIPKDYVLSLGEGGLLRSFLEIRQEKAK
ncbi:MAG: molybdopterin-binding protein [Desulfurococcaceae archaeon]